MQTNRSIAETITTMGLNAELDTIATLLGELVTDTAITSTVGTDVLMKIIKENETKPSALFPVKGFAERFKFARSRHRRRKILEELENHLDSIVLLTRVPHTSSIDAASIVAPAISLLYQSGKINRALSHRKSFDTKHTTYQIQKLEDTLRALTKLVQENPTLYYTCNCTLIYIIPVIHPCVTK